VSGAPLIRADMRALPVRPRSMDLTVNLFTSFGYFDRDDEHAAVLAEMAATVRPGGWLVLDFLHAATVRRGLVPGKRRFAEGATASLRLSADGRFVCKSIRLDDGRRFEERVRLFEPAELEAMLAAADVRVTHRFGDYEGGALESGSSRTVLMGEVA